MRSVKATKWKPASVSGRRSWSRASRRQRAIQAKERSTLPCTMLPRPARAVPASAPRGWRDAKDDLDPPMVDLDPADHQPDDLASGSPIEQVEALADLGREVLRAPDHQGEVAPRLGGGRQRRAVFLQLGDAGPQVGQTRLELRAFDDAVDQPPDPAPQRADATLDLAHVRVHRRARQ